MTSPELPPQSPPPAPAGGLFPVDGFCGQPLDRVAPHERRGPDLMAAAAWPAKAPAVPAPAAAARPERADFLDLPDREDDDADDRFSLGKLAATLVSAATVAPPRPKTFPVPGPAMLPDESLQRLMERFSPGLTAADRDREAPEDEPLDLMDTGAPTAPAPAPAAVRPATPRPPVPAAPVKPNPVRISALRQAPKIGELPPLPPPPRPIPPGPLTASPVPAPMPETAPQDLFADDDPPTVPATEPEGEPFFADGFLMSGEEEAETDPPAAAPEPVATPFSSLPTPVSEIQAVPRPVAAERGTGLAIGGGILILLGIFLACLMPLRWLELDRAGAGTDAASLWEAACHRAALVLLGAGALTFLSLGAGSLAMRRWAPAVIHALGWVSALVALFLLAEGTAAAFYLSEVPDGGLPPALLRLLVPLGLGGLLVPLLFIAFYQRPAIAEICEAADPQVRWTDRVMIPGVMVFLSGLLLAVGAAAMLQHRDAFPWFGTVLENQNARLAWTGTGLLGLLAATAAVFRSRAGWWVLALIFTALAVSCTLTGDAAGWQTFLSALGHPQPGILAGTGPVRLWTGLAFVHLAVILLMSRRAFSSHAR